MCQTLLAYLCLPTHMLLYLLLIIMLIRNIPNSIISCCHTLFSMDGYKYRPSPVRSSMEQACGSKENGNIFVMVCGSLSHLHVISQ